MPDDLGIPPDLHAATERIRQFTEQTQARAGQFKEVGERTESATVTEQRADGSITVTVATSGALTDLRLTNQIREQDAERTSAQVLELVRRAQSRIADRVQEIVDETLDDSELSQQVAAQVVSSFRNRFPESESAPGASRPPDTEDWDERSVLEDPRS